jgi:hypothetical protein
MIRYENNHIRSEHATAIANPAAQFSLGKEAHPFYQIAMPYAPCAMLSCRGERSTAGKDPF